jgi:hypothetical protein
MLLLAFRMTRHYWRLVMRQLILTPGFYGESLPYRATYVKAGVGESDDVGLICGKFDASDYAAPHAAVYIPLRVVSNVRRAVISGSTVVYFNYTLGPTVDFRVAQWNAYSDASRTTAFGR